ncbi:hypothetical protein GCM10028824_18100 [Hymenobacter segetis]|uniref:DUF3379 family protein n=1 Tax=Hymenobacter segetis TaxID=2025509 RepID=A0ABU9LZK8_9BACT
MSNSDARPGTDQEWEDLMAQLRTQPLAQHRPFFYTRVQARLATAPPPAWRPGWIRRPAYALLLGALVLLLGGDDAAIASAGGATVAASAPAPR